MRPIKGSFYFDNRNQEDVQTYQEARIEALRRRVTELEAENKKLLSQRSLLLSGSPREREYVTNMFGTRRKA